MHIIIRGGIGKKINLFIVADDIVLGVQMSFHPLINAWYRFRFLLNVLIFILIAKASFAFDIVEITKNGNGIKSALYELCDITNTTEGIFLTEFVSEAAKNSTSVEPQNSFLQTANYKTIFILGVF